MSEHCLTEEQAHRILENLQRIALLSNSLKESSDCVKSKADLFELIADNVVVVREVAKSLNHSSNCIASKIMILKDEYNALYRDIEGMLNRGDK